MRAGVVCADMVRALPLLSSWGGGRELGPCHAVACPRADRACGSGRRRSGGRWAAEAAGGLVFFHHWRTTMLSHCQTRDQLPFSFRSRFVQVKHGGFRNAMGTRRGINDFGFSETLGQNTLCSGSLSQMSGNFSTFLVFLFETLVICVLLRFSVFYVPIKKYCCICLLLLSQGTMGRRLVDPPLRART